MCIGKAGGKSNTGDSMCTGKTSMKDNLGVSIKVINVHPFTLISTTRNLSYRIIITLMKRPMYRDNRYTLFLVVKEQKTKHQEGPGYVNYDTSSQ